MSSKVDKITSHIEPAIEALGFELWGLELLSQGKHSVLRVFIEKEGGVNMDDCAAVSRQISAVLDVEEPIQGRYNLEVSSPGLNRPLYKESHYRRYIGENLQVKMRMGIDGRRNFKGELLAIDDSALTLRVDDEEVRLMLSDIDKANLMRQ